MIKFKPPENSQYLSFSFYDNNEINKLFYEKLMVETKNVFNLTLFSYNVFDSYKLNIFNELLDYVKNDIQLVTTNKKITINRDYDEFILNKFSYYFDEYVKIKDIIKTNNTEIYKFIINYVNTNNIVITFKNFNNIYNTIYNDLSGLNLIVLPNKQILFDDIIYKILYSIYNKNYINIKNKILNHEPINNETIYNAGHVRFCLQNHSVLDELIDEIKNSIFIEFIKSKDVKEEIEYLLSNEELIDKLLFKKLKANTTYISRFVYKKLGDKSKFLQSTMITATINKVHDSIKSYYELLKNNKKANKPRFLGATNKFILSYFYSDIVVKNNKLYMFTSEYLSKNFSEVFGIEYIKLSNNKYVHKKYLSKINNKKIKKKDNYIYNDYFINNKNIIDSRYIIVEIFNKIKKEKIKTITIKEVFGAYKVIFTYENPKANIKNTTINVKGENTLSIDLGVNNLLTIYDPKGKQYIISGGPLKSINYYVTNKIGEAQSKKDIIKMNKLEKLREDKINDYFNKIVKWLTTKYLHKDLIIIGYNKNWKQNSNLGKKGNLSFNKIPFLKLINKIKMKFNTITTEESYTSKCDSLSLEELNKKDLYNGKRIKRGLFESLNGKKINADLNGAINIMRKQIQLNEITGYSLYNPIRVNIFHDVNPVDNVC
jgi:putative transposase